MKLKLRIRKDLKRDLKGLALKKDLERKELVEKLLEEFVNENKEIWMDDIEEFIENTKKLEAEIVEINSNESLNDDEKKQSIKKIKEKYGLIRYNSTMLKKKTETLIINLGEQIYYGLLLIAEDHEMSIEQLGITVLTEYAHVNKI